MYKILVTGSSGTIGTRLCEELLGQSDDVIGIDRRQNKWSQKIDEITLHQDLRDKSSFDKIPRDIDLIIHLAANARVYNLVRDPTLARDNFEITFNTLDFARKNDIKKFIFASSRETYGNSDKLVYSENEVRIKNCESPYTASKIGGEALVHSYQQCYTIDFIIFRFSNVYGMYDDSDRVIPLFIKLTKEGKDLTIFGKEKLLDFTYIDDCVSGILKGIENFDNVKNDTYNLGSGKGTSIIKIAESIQKLMRGKNKIIVKENRTGEVIKFIADISRAKEKLGYEPQITIEEGLKKTIQWYQENIL